MGFIDKNTVGAYIVRAEIYTIIGQILTDRNQSWEFDENGCISLDILG